MVFSHLFRHKPGPASPPRHPPPPEKNRTPFSNIVFEKSVPVKSDSLNDAEVRSDSEKSTSFNEQCKNTVLFNFVPKNVL